MTTTNNETDLFALLAAPVTADDLAHAAAHAAEMSKWDAIDSSRRAAAVRRSEIDAAIDLARARRNPGRYGWGM